MNVNLESSGFNDGAILVNKPSGPTSADVVRRIKHTYGVKKIGHGGTLDPMATGLLVILVGKATKLQDQLLTGSKTYRGSIRLGFSTDTDDVSGQVKERKDGFEGISEREFDSLKPRLLQKFSGSIEQVPPKISALKVKGKPSYKRVRAGEEVSLAARTVQVKHVELIWLGASLLEYEVEVSSGFYVRSLARDIGEELGCLAALETIERTRVGEFQLSEATNLAELEDSDLLPEIIGLDSLVQGMFRIELSQGDCNELRHGKQGLLSEVQTPEEIDSAAIFSEFGELCALIEKKEVGLSPIWRIRTVFL